VTPMGCRSAKRREEALCDGMTSPYARRPSSANHSTKLAAYATSPVASASGLPCARAGCVAARRSPRQRMASDSMNEALDDVSDRATDMTGIVCPDLKT